MKNLRDHIANLRAIAEHIYQESTKRAKRQPLDAFRAAAVDDLHRLADELESREFSDWESARFRVLTAMRAAAVQTRLEIWRDFFELQFSGPTARVSTIAQAAENADYMLAEYDKRAADFGAEPGDPR